METTHDRPDRDVEELCDLGVREAVDVDEDDDAAEPLGERLQRVEHDGIERLAHDDRFRRVPAVVVLGEAFEGEILIIEQFGTTTAGPVYLRVAHDREEPRSGVAAVEGVDRAERPQQGVLDEVLGVGRSRHECPGDPQQKVDLGDDVASEGVALAFGGARRRSRHAAETRWADVAFPPECKRSTEGSRNVTRREHRRYRRTVDAWIDGELDDAAARSTAAHLRECWDCSSAAEMTKLVKHSLRRLPDRQPRPLTSARLHRYANRLARA